MKSLGLCFALCAPSLLPCGCNSVESSAAQPTVVSGRSQQPLKDAAASTRPDVVAVLVSVQGTDNWCTGIVLGPDLVLTAEHCFAPAGAPDIAVDCVTATLPAISPASSAWVIAGENAKTADSSQVYAVSNVKLPAGASKLCGDDIALLELSTPLPAANPAAIVTAVPASGTTFLAVGYGTDGVQGGQQRQNAAARVECTGSDCNDARIAAGELLATSNACAGDSGSPAIDAEGRSFAMAVRSSADCSQTAYLQLASYFTWLASNTMAIAVAQGRPVPSWAAAAQTDAGAPSSDPDAAMARTADAPSTHSDGGGGCAIHRGIANRDHAVPLLLILAGLAMTRRRSSQRPVPR